MYDKNEGEATENKFAKLSWLITLSLRIRFSILSSSLFVSFPELLQWAREPSNDESHFSQRHNVEDIKSFSTLPVIQFFTM